MSTVVIQAYDAGAVVIQAYDAGTIVETQGPTGPVLPTALLVEAWEATSLVLSDGAQIPSITGLILGKALAQATAGSRPLYRANLNASGYPGMDFDGADDYLWSADATLNAVFSEAGANSPDVTIYAVVNGAGSNAKWSMAAGSSSSDTPILGIQSNASTSETFYIRNDGGTLRLAVSTTAVAASTRVITMQLLASGSHNTWDNRTARVAGGTPAGSGPYTFNRLCIGGLLRSVFSNASTQDWHALYIADTVHDATARATVWDYIAATWGTP